MPETGVIAGSGLYEMPGFRPGGERRVSTPFGEPSGAYVLGELSGVQTVFLPRHGPAHTLPPHEINYRANIWGFRELGVKALLSINASGGIAQGLAPGDIAVIEQVIDMTGGARRGSFHDGPQVVHIDLTEPFCAELRAAVLISGNKQGIELKDGGTYACVNGPRLETAAEIKHLALIGADMVGMTVMPEAALAREAGICFTAISVITNYAAGISKEKLTTTKVVKVMQAANNSLRALLSATLPSIPANRSCTCRDSLKDATM